MRKATLTKIADLTTKHVDRGNHPLRTDSMEGVELFPPTVGSYYVIMNNEPLTEGANHRRIMTSMVRLVLELSDRTILETLNSRYVVTYQDRLLAIN